MSVVVSIRNGNISDTLKNYAEAKASALVEGYPKITSTKVVLDAQKSRYKAEILIIGKKFNIEAEHEEYDMYDAIDAVIEKAGIQLKKYYDKKQDHFKPDAAIKNIELKNEENAKYDDEEEETNI